MKKFFRLPSVSSFPQVERGRRDVSAKEKGGRRRNHYTITFVEGKERGTEGDKTMMPSSPSAALCMKCQEKSIKTHKFHSRS